MPTLTGKIALVAGATRGAGRGIACMLGEAGATVYCTGRSTRATQAAKGEQSPKPGQAVSPFDLARRPETIEETAEMVTARGGTGIAVRVDHTKRDEVAGLIDRIRRESGRLDILVNDIWGGDQLAAWGQTFWEHSLDDGLLMMHRAIDTHIITSHAAAPLMIESGPGLIIEITDGEGYYYRGTFFYDLVKTSIIRMAFGMAHDLKKHGVTALALTPGFLRSEAMLEHFGVTEANWREGAAKEPGFIASETPFYVGRAVAALAADPEVATKMGRVYSSWGLAREYGFTDVDGEQPQFDRWIAEHAPEISFRRCDDGFYEYWG